MFFALREVRKQGKKGRGCLSQLHGSLFDLFKEEYVRLVRDTGTLHSLPQFLRLCELAGLLREGR